MLFKFFIRSLMQAISAECFYDVFFGVVTFQFLTSEEGMHCWERIWLVMKLRCCQNLYATVLLEGLVAS